MCTPLSLSHPRRGDPRGVEYVVQGVDERVPVFYLRRRDKTIGTPRVAQKKRLFQARAALCTLRAAVGYRCAARVVPQKGEKGACAPARVLVRERGRGTGGLATVGVL